MARSSSPRTPLLERWARFSHRRRGRIIGGWALILVGLIALQVMYGGKFISEFNNPGAESQRALDMLALSARADGSSHQSSGTSGKHAGVTDSV